MAQSWYGPSNIMILPGPDGMGMCGCGATIKGVGKCRKCELEELERSAEAALRAMDPDFARELAGQ